MAKPRDPSLPDETRPVPPQCSSDCDWDKGGPRSRRCPLHGTACASYSMAAGERSRLRGELEDVKQRRVEAVAERDANAQAARELEELRHLAGEFYGDLVFMRRDCEWIPARRMRELLHLDQPAAKPDEFGSMSGLLINGQRPLDARPDLNEWGLSIAHVVATRATCARRRVGCVLVDARGRIRATGYNGPPRGFPHCTIHPCGGVGQPSGQGLELCEAVHAEQNALLQCPDVEDLERCYVTTAPCVTCVKLLLNTGVQTIIFLEDYPQADAAKLLWTVKGGRVWIQVKP